LNFSTAKIENYYYILYTTACYGEYGYMTATLDKTAEYKKPPAPPETFYRMSVARYHQMISAGIFNEDDAVELLEGRIVNKITFPYSLTSR
jgi:hypothetical protein